jgi:membrane protein YqaA with SNARE-associated domain
VRQTPVLSALFTILVVASAAVAVALLLNDTRMAWMAAALAAAGPVAGYLLTRIASGPFDPEDVGNWLEPLVLVALFIEISVSALGRSR